MMSPGKKHLGTCAPAVGETLATEQRIHIACQLCGADATRHLFTKNSYNFVKCCRCGLVYVNPQPTCEELMAFYGPAYLPSLVNGLARMKSRLDSARRGVERLLEFTSGGRLLDVGCGPGLFLSVARERFAVWGVEIIPGAAEHAKSLLGESATIICGEFLKVDLPAEEFDVVTMHHCLEHMPLPLDNLIRAHRCLKAEGLLALALPNLSSISALLRGSNWRHYRRPPKHLFFFTPRTIAALVRKAGFPTVRCRIGTCHPFRDIMVIYALKH